MGLFPLWHAHCAGWATGCMNGIWVRSVMSVSNNLIHLCLEIPHCAHQCALPKLSLLVCVVCSCSLFSDLATFFSFFTQLSVFISPVLRRVPHFICCTNYFCVPLLLLINTRDLFVIVTFILKKSVFHISAAWTQKSRTHHSWANVPGDLQLIFTFQRSMDITAIDNHTIIWSHRSQTHNEADL